MKDIKTSKKTVKGLSPAAQRMKNAFIQTKAKAEQTIREQEPQQKAASVEYAENAISNKTQIGEKKAKSAIKTAQKSIKTAKTAKATVKTVQVTAKTTAKTAQAAVKTTKATPKAVTAAGKAIVAAVKAIVEIIIAGGWIAVVVIFVIVLICAVGMAIAFFVGKDGDVSDIPSDFSFSSSYFEQFNSFRLSVRE